MLVLAMCLVAALQAGVAHSAESRAHGAFPMKPVQLVVPFSAGGPNDVFGRALARKMSESMGQAFVVVNRDGAAGVIGTDFVAKAAPDGYTLLFNGSGPLSIEPAFRRKLVYDPRRDFSPIGPEVRARVSEQGGTMTPSSPEDFAALIASELEKSAQTIKAAGIKRE